MKAQTPGPWALHRERFGKDGIFQSLTIRGPVELEASGWTHDPSFVCEVLREANAHLIAAAPEMLEELETMIAILEKGTETPEDREYMIDYAKKVAAKARGENE